MNLDDFSTVVDDRRYVNPQVSLDEQNAFIDNLRTAQGARTAEIAKDTYNLGTAVPSNLGGLGGAGSYFTARYQTPQTNVTIGDLRTAAQAQALNDVLNNEIAKAKQRYNNAYKAYQKRKGNNNPTNNPLNPGNNPDLPVDTDKGKSDGDVDTNKNTGEGYVNVENGQTFYTKNGKKYSLRSVNAGEYAQNMGTFDAMKPADGYTYARNGKTFIYVNNGKQPSGWYVVTGVN